jgi:hypothetical protein
MSGVNGKSSSFAAVAAVVDVADVETGGGRQIALAIPGGNAGRIAGRSMMR